MHIDFTADKWAIYVMEEYWLEERQYFTDL